MTTPGDQTRFHEDKAASTVWRADAPDLETGIAAIRNVVKTLLAQPGV